MQEGGKEGAASSQAVRDFRAKRAGANSASVTACCRKGAWPCANPVRGPFPLLEGKSLTPS